MKNRIMECAALLFGLVFVLLLLPNTAAAVVWSDNFDDGNCDGWTVTEGTFDASNGYLTAVYNGDFRHKIWHPSSQVEGTWSFDIYPGPEGGGAIFIEFLGNGTDRYDLNIDPRTEYDALGIYFHNNLFPLGYVEIEGGLDTWTHFKITRNSTGGLHLYVNATSPTAEPVLTVIDTTYSYSDRFLFTSLYCEDARIDNIVVNNESVDTTSTTPSTPTTNSGVNPPPIDTTLLLVGAGVAGVVIIVAVTFMRRR